MPLISIQIYYKVLSAAFSLLLVLGVSTFAPAQTSTFTYQGRFTDTTAVQPTSGTYDFQFALYDAVTGGTLVASNATTTTNISVVNGVFTAPLDFGASAFPGASRFVEILVKKPSETTYTMLAPRQPITSTPYAVRALNATNVEATSGNSVVSALNSAATSTTISSTVLPANLVRLKPAAVQTSASDDPNGADALINMRGTFTNPANGAADFKVLHNGGFVATGFVRDAGTTTGCASSIPATGAGTRFMWFPCRGAVRFGRVSSGETNWDDANMEDFTFAGGNQVTARGYGAFAYGENVTVSSVFGVGFGSAISVRGTAGFAAGASNLCSGFVCIALGYTVGSLGQGSTAVGYRTIAGGDYTTALGFRATTCVSGISNIIQCNGGSRTGAFVWGDGSPTGSSFATDFVNAQFDNEFRIRASGGIRLRTSTAANAAAGVSGNTGCDLAAGSGAFVCSSSRTIKSNFMNVKGEDVLLKIRHLPLTTWNYALESASSRHIGPVAEDFYSAFRFGESNQSIAIQDLAGVALVGVQSLEERTEKLQKENNDLKEQLRQQQNTIDALVKSMCAVNPTPKICQRQ